MKFWGCPPTSCKREMFDLITLFPFFVQPIVEFTVLLFKTIFYSFIMIESTFFILNGADLILLLYKIASLLRVVKLARKNYCIEFNGSFTRIRLRANACLAVLLQFSRKSFFLDPSAIYLQKRERNQQWVMR